MKWSSAALTTLIFIFFSTWVEAYSQDWRNTAGIKGTVTSICETEKYYWVGTTNGLYSVKKKNGTLYHYTSRNSVLLSDTITCIAAKPDGEVYAGTTNGLMRYDNYTFIVYTGENSSLKSNRITAICCAADGSIYAGTQSGGLTVFSGIRNRSYTQANAPFDSNHVTGIEKKGDTLEVMLENNFRVWITKQRIVKI